MTAQSSRIDNLDLRSDAAKRAEGERLALDHMWDFPHVPMFARCQISYFSVMATLTFVVPERKCA